MMVVAQVGIPRDELSTVTALVTTTPNLGGVLGISIIGNGWFFRALVSTLLTTLL